MKKKVILVVSAHAADWCTRAGGTLLKFARDGHEIVVFSFTYGEHGESGSYWKDNPASDVEACKRCREEEARNAAAIIGVKAIEFFDYRDYPLVFPEGAERSLVHRILELRPDVVLTHWIDDPFNMDHEITGKAVIRAVSAAGMLGALPGVPAHFIPDLFLFETTMPHSEFNRFTINSYVDIGDVFEKKIEAVSQFRAQPQLVEYYTRCALNRGVQATDWARGRRQIQYAEAFNRYVPHVGDQLVLTEL